MTVRSGLAAVATFALAAEFGKLMAAEARRRGAGHIRQLVILGDGAAWIWNLAANHFPEATQIVDLYHAREHLHDLASSWSSCSPATGRTGWANGSPSSTPATFPRSAPPPAPSPLTGRKAQELATARGYFEHNAHRMHYARFKKLGMFAGSGAVEAGFEAVIGQRLKLSSMKWSQARAADVMTLRCLQASDRWEQSGPSPARHQRPEPICQRSNNQTTKARQGYRPVTYIHVTPPVPRFSKNVGPPPYDVGRAELGRDRVAA
jgi:hypothetical protein